MSSKIKQARREKAKAIARKDFKEASGFCSYIGDLLKNEGEYEEAIEEFAEDLAICKQIEDKIGEANAHRQLGECYSLMLRHNEAIKEQLLYYKLVKQAKNQIELQRAFATIGYTYLLHAQSLSCPDEDVLKKSENALNHALKLSEGIKDKVGEREYQQMRSRIYINLGLIYDLRDNLKECNNYFQKAMHLCRNFGFKDDLLRCQTSLASFHLKRGELNNASRFCDEALNTSKQINDKTCICDALMAKGEIMMLLRDFEGAKRYFKKAYKLKSSKSQTEKALKSLKISYFICDDLNKFNKTNDLETKILLCDKLGDHFVALELFSGAIEFYQEELKYSLEYGKSKSDLAKIYVSIAQTYADEKDFNEALIYSEKELECNEGNQYEECNTLLNIAYYKDSLKFPKEEIIKVYELAFEKANGNEALKSNVLKQYSTFLKTNSIRKERASKIDEELSLLNNTIDIDEDEEIEDDEDVQEINIYDEFDVNEISESSDENDSETEDKDKNLGKRSRKKKTNVKLNEVGETQLHRACIEGKLKFVERLLEKGHPVNCRDYCGWLPLHEAVNHGHFDIVKLLIEEGANINDAGGAKCDGITPLHDACSCGHINIIRLLIKKGAKVNVLTKNGETPLDCFLAWKKRVDLNGDELKECETLEKNLKESLEKSGFRSRASKISIVTSKEKSPSISPKSSPTAECSLNNSNLFNEEETDYFDPRTAVRTYKSTITNLRRSNDPNRDLCSNQRKSRSKQDYPALLNQNEVVNDWLEDDCGLNKSVKRKMPMRDAYEVFDVSKRRITDEAYCRKKSSNNKNYYVEENEEIQQVFADHSNDMNNMENYHYNDHSDDDDDNSCEVVTSNNKSSNQSSINETNVTKNVDSKISKTCVRVSIEGKTLMVPVPNPNETCEWLINEVSQRYFKMHKVKPIIVLETVDGALLSESDCISDVITDNVVAKVESWKMDPMPDRYNEICCSNNIVPIEDLLANLQAAQISGRFKLNNINLTQHQDQIDVLIRSFNRQNKLREIDISNTNFLSDEKFQSFINLLSTLPNLQILNFKCTSISNLDLILDANCSNLIELNLSYNNIDDSSGDSIIKLIKKFPKLIIMDLRANELSTKTFTRSDVCKTIQESNLRSILLEFNHELDQDLVRRFNRI